MDRRNGLSLREAIRQNAKAKQQQQQEKGSGMLRVYRQARASGHLNASSRSLREFPKEILRLHELVEPDEKSWECMPLTKVDLSYNDIPEMPESISRLHALTSLKLRHNKLRELPDALFLLKTLTSLDLSNNLLSECLSESLGKLVNLRELGLENNKFMTLPESICSLENLEVLRVEDNQLTALPAQFGNLQRLHTFGGHSNQLTALPRSFGRLTCLSTLDLKKNSLTTIEHAVERMTRLRILDLRQNKLQEFPSLPGGSPPLDQLMLGYNLLTEVSEESILRVKDTLTVFDLRDNKLQELPEKFAHLYRLKSVDFSNNDLHDLPPALGYLKDLDHITIDGNPLRSIRRSAIASGTQALKKYLRTRGSPPVGVDALEQEFDEFALREIQQKEAEHGGLVMDTAEAASQYEYIFRDAASNGTLQMIDMRLHSIPEQLQGQGKFRFSETLVQLNLSKNKLGELPSVIGEFHALQSLAAEECGLKTIDPSITMLYQLQHLRLRKNMLTAESLEAFLIHEDEANICHSLKELDVRNNVIKTMPTRLRVLTNVDTLLLSYNRLQSLDDFPWAEMRRLSVVSLSDNQLESLGAIYELPLLTSLSVENNNLRQIPAELGGCENLRAIYIMGNPQRSVRLNIVNEGPEAILKYLRNRLPIGYESPAKSFLDTAPNVGRNRPRPATPLTGVRTNRALSMPAAVASEGVRSAESSQQTRYESPNPAEYKRARRASAVSPGAFIDLRQPSFDSASDEIPSATPSQVATSANAAAIPTTSALTASEPPPSTTASAASASASEDSVLKDYDERIKALEAELENYALSQPKKYALKKEVATVRSLKIRHLRDTGGQAA